MRAWSHRTKVLPTLGTNHDSGTLIRPASPSDINFASGELHYRARGSRRISWLTFQRSNRFTRHHHCSFTHLERRTFLFIMYTGISILRFTDDCLCLLVLLLPQATTLSADTMSDSVEGAINIWLCIMRLAMTGFGLKRGVSMKHLEREILRAVESWQGRRIWNFSPGYYRALKRTLSMDENIQLLRKSDPAAMVTLLP